VAEEDTERRLVAAIMSADVAGYSRLMGKDEPGTLSALRGVSWRTSRAASGLVPLRQDAFDTSAKIERVSQ